MINRNRKRPDPAESALQALADLQPDTDRATQNQALSEALANASFRVVAKAATLAGERMLHERSSDLLAAWPHFLDDAAKRDPQCIAKSAICAALLALECDNTAFWLGGIRYVQLEPAWERPADTAADVRCICAMGLVNSRYRRAIIELVSLLNDPEYRVRSGAARAIACGDPQQAEPVLRLKIHIGDPEAEVLGECFTALLSVAPEDSMALVGSRLRDADEAVRDYAALALGESRHPLALDLLRTAWDDPLLSHDLRGVLVRAAALHRSEAAFDWLLGIVEKGRNAEAAFAVDALSVYDRNSKLMQRLETAQASRRQAQGRTTR
ncbi:MAG: hypothetical protein M3Y79_12515 [Pseudomonadota bacterium]|nr:hypothetical protein [Pseudomonadota bacterium]